MRGIKEYSAPASLDYALKLLSMHQGQSLVVAGGTHLALQKKSKCPFILDIKNLGLNYIKQENNYIKIGATTRAVDIINNDLLKSFASGIIVNAASKIGSVLTQNLVTIGGNVYSMLPWSNLPPALLALGACIELTSLEGSRYVDIKELYNANTRKYIDHNEIITAVLLPISSQNYKTSYKVFSLTENDYDIVIVAVALDMNDIVCKKAKIALGAAISPATTLDEASSLLEGNELSSELIEKVASKAVENIKLVGDFRTTDEHRVDVIKTLVKRALEEHKV